MHLTEAKYIQGDYVKPTAALQMGGSPPQSWLHSPPAQMPWGTKQPPLVRFTGGLYGGGIMSNPSMPFSPEFCQPYHFPLSPVPGPSRTQTSGLKRKLDLDDEAEMMSAVNKLHISETKMATHQAGLHALTDQNGLEDEAVGPRLVLSDELKQMTAQEHLLPKPLMDRMRAKNTMALVLWQPPKPRLIPYPEPEEGEEEDGNNNNNSGESIDLNVMPTFSNGLPSTSFDNDDVDMEAL